MNLKLIVLALIAWHLECGAEAASKILSQKLQVAALSDTLAVTNSEILGLFSSEVLTYLTQHPEDREFVEKSLEEIEDLFQQLSSETLSGVLKKSSHSSMVSTPLEIEEFISIKMRYEGLFLVIQNRIKGLDLPILPSSLKRRRTTGSYQKPAQGFAPVVEYYSAKLNEVDKIAQHLPFRIQDRMGLTKHISGLNPHAFHLAILTPDEITRQKKTINRLQGELDALRAAQDRLTFLASRLINAFLKSISRSGRTEAADRYPVQTAAFRQLFEYFWARSYLRAVYGIPLGAIPLYFKKPLGKIRDFTDDPYGFVRVNGDPVRENLGDLLDNYRQNLSFTNERTRALLEQVFSPLASHQIYFGGILDEGDLIDLADLMIELIVADAVEDFTLRQAYGQELMHALYETRFYSTRSSRSKTFLLECAYGSDRASEGCKHLELEERYSHNRQLRTNLDNARWYSLNSLSVYQTAKRLADRLEVQLRLQYQSPP